MDIPIKADVICKDEDCGHVSCVIVNPKNEDLSYVVVEENQHPYDEFIVPVEMIKNTTSKSIQLSCSKEELTHMENFIEHHFVPIEKVYGIYPVRRQVFVPYSSYSKKYADIPYERIPKGDVTFHRGSVIEATDGPVGKLDEFQIDSSGEHISHLIIKEGHLWNKKEIGIPVSEIDHIEKDTIYIKLNKDQVANLPSLPVKRRL
ncbi:MAG: PRC-barrel domain-containing protein [Anaerolineales bacterium]|jgi:uncharacterized protein YrrD